jgi:CutA1 divalent ion tolerance protein
MAEGAAPSHDPGERLVIVYVTFPDLAHAKRIARELIAQRLAACVNLTADMTAVYRRQPPFARPTPTAFLPWWSWTSPAGRPPTLIGSVRRPGYRPSQLRSGRWNSSYTSRRDFEPPDSCA